MVNGFTDMIAASLNLKEPWYIEGAEFLPEKQEVNIYVNVREAAVFACPVCGGATVLNGYEPTERVWRHGNCMFYPSFVHCKRPRIHCPKCGGSKVVNAPFERKNSRFTLLFEGYAMLILADTPRAKAAKVLRCDEKSLATLLNYWVDDAVKSCPLGDVEPGQQHLLFSSKQDVQQDFRVKSSLEHHLFRAYESFSVKVRKQYAKGSPVIYTKTQEAFYYGEKRKEETRPQSCDDRRQT